MLVVKVEIWPGGDGDRAEILGVAALANVSDLAGASDYVVVGGDHHGNDLEGLVRGHIRSDGIWPLVAAVGRAMAATSARSRQRAARVRLPRLLGARRRDHDTLHDARELLDRFEVAPGVRVRHPLRSNRRPHPAGAHHASQGRAPGQQGPAR